MVWRLRMKDVIGIMVIMLVLMQPEMSQPNLCTRRLTCGFGIDQWKTENHNVLPQRKKEMGKSYFRITLSSRLSLPGRNSALLCGRSSVIELIWHVLAQTESAWCKAVLLGISSFWSFFCCTGQTSASNNIFPFPLSFLGYQLFLINWDHFASKFFVHFSTSNSVLTAYMLFTSCFFLSLLWLDRKNLIL